MRTALFFLVLSIVSCFSYAGDFLYRVNRNSYLFITDCSDHASSITDLVQYQDAPESQMLVLSPFIAYYFGDSSTHTAYNETPSPAIPAVFAIASSQHPHLLQLVIPAGFSIQSYTDNNLYSWPFLVGEYYSLPNTSHQLQELMGKMTNLGITHSLMQ